MKRIYFALLLCAALLSVSACKKNNIVDSAEDVLSSIQLTAAKDNALRYYVDLDFDSPCSYRINYWESSSTSKVRSTRTFESEGKSGRTVIMFVKPETDYSFNVTVISSGKEFTTEKSFDFTTKSLPLGVPTYTLDSKYGDSFVLPGYILHGQASSPTGYLVFTDTDGNVVWYQDFDEAVRHFYFDQESRSFVVLTGFKNSLSDIQFQRFCNKFVRIDLEGNIIEEWKTSSENVEFPHHDVKILDDGSLVLLHGVARNYDLSPIGGNPSVDVYGDGFTVFDKDGKQTFTWDTSCELDPVNDTYLNVLDMYYDLVHANSVSRDTDGNYYFTLNNLNELWKIDGRNGDVLYRVGGHGDVSVPENGHTSGIHSSVPLAPDRILVLDNGSTKNISRALIYKVDAAAKTASVELSVAIPSEYSSTDRSNCELLTDQELIFFGSTAGRCCLFTDMEGNVKKVIKRNGISYRTHYFPDIEY